MRQTAIGHVTSVFLMLPGVPGGGGKGPGLSQQPGFRRNSAGTQAQRTDGRNLIPAFGNSSSVSSQHSRRDS